ncbi:unnamed protein product (mitochondrion) [Komagataella phaffii CBS 7435]|uniref:NADH-ubiquinone oxidoreductase chain 2 n=1 Tax=Komagataella phaffii (strain ATCC 76273 / CBS 7435 / CECT 11047 / NRRL Y-11430 / Wegner 21-1) TaxID=981350 RepID=F2R0K6_KOMPC|nr:unnamed protein product [Komagataella phaffii CBS 7435]
MLFTSLLLMMVYGSLVNKSHLLTKLINRLGLMIMMYTLLIHLNMNTLENLSMGMNMFNNLLLINSFNNTMMELMLIMCILYVLLMSFNITGLSMMDNLNYSKRTFMVMVLFNMMGLTLLPLVNDMMMLFIMMELQSYSLYLLTAMFNESHNSTKSALYYFMVGSMASFIMLDATVSMYDDLGLTNIQYILMYMDKLEMFDLLCLLFGLFIKIGLAPFYSYSMTMYSLSPTMITNYMSLMPKLSMLTLMYMIMHYINMVNNTDLNYVMSFLILISMFMGSFGGLNVIRMKTLLAYSSLLNVSYMLLAILSNSNESIIAYIYYIMQYSLTHMNMFSIMLVMSMYLPIMNNNMTSNTVDNKYSNNGGNMLNVMMTKYSPMEYINQLKNLFINNMFMAMALCMSMFSLMGMPPLTGFYGKYLVLMSGLNNGYVLLSIVLMMASSMSTVYYATMLKVLSFDTLSFKDIMSNNLMMNTSPENNNNEIKPEISNVMSYVISSLTLIMLLIIIQYENMVKGAYLVLLYNWV